MSSTPGASSVAAGAAAGICRACVPGSGLLRNGSFALRRLQRAVLAAYQRVQHMGVAAAAPSALRHRGIKTMNGHRAKCGISRAARLRSRTSAHAH